MKIFLNIRFIFVFIVDLFLGVSLWVVRVFLLEEKSLGTLASYSKEDHVGPFVLTQIYLSLSQRHHLGGRKSINHDQ